jgi:hypothetical protein
VEMGIDSKGHQMKFASHKKKATATSATPSAIASDPFLGSMWGK